MVRVITSYEDGHYSLARAPDESEIFVAITEQEWEEYQAFVRVSREWHSRMRDLDNEFMAKCDAELDK